MKALFAAANAYGTAASAVIAGMMAVSFLHMGQRSAPVSYTHLHTGASILNYTSEVPIEFVQIMQALLILLISAQTFLRKTKNKVIFKDSHETISKEEKLA